MNTQIKNFFAKVLGLEKKTRHMAISEKLFSSIAQTATDAILIADVNSTVLFCNTKAVEFFGYSGQEMLSMDLCLLMPEKYREAHRKGIKRFVATRQGRLIGHTIEVEGLKKGGHIFPMELSLSFFEQQGVFFTAIIRDITSRKQAEQAFLDKQNELEQANAHLLHVQEVLEQTKHELEKRVAQRTAALAASEKQLRLITDALPVLISYVDKEERYRFTNQAYEWWFNLERQAILGKTMREIAGEEAYKAIKDKVAQALAGQSIYFETLMNYQRVEARYVSFHFMPHWEGNTVVGFFLLATDITQRKKAEEEARAASKRVQLLLESIPHLTWTSAPEDASITYFNQRWYEYTGMTREQSIGTGWQQALHPEDLAIVLEHRMLGRREGKPYTIENRYRHRDGSYRWHLARIVPINDEKNGISLWLGTATDIHEQKLLQQALQQTTQELAASNEELRSTTEELQATNEELLEANQSVLETNQKLEQANRQLEESNQQLLIINTDLDNFIYTASHDLKSPIANIEGLMMVLGKKLSAKFTLDQEHNQLFSLLGASVDRLKITIAKLTEIAKVQKDTQEETEVISIEKVIEEVMEDLAPLIADTEVHIDKHIEVDELRFAHKHTRSILFNLLSNAIKYQSQEREPQVHIASKREGSFLLLEVADNGIGIAENNVQKLFTMFKRFHTHVEGTGIGLYIIKRIVENAGGRIQVDSNVNKGTAFRIYLPYKE